MQNEKVRDMARNAAISTLFVPMMWAFVRSGATVLVIDGACILALLWLGRHLLKPFVSFFRARPVLVLVLRDLVFHCFVVLFFVSVFALEALPQPDKWKAVTAIIVAVVAVILIPKGVHRTRV